MLQLAEDAPSQFAADATRPKTLDPIQSAIRLYNHCRLHRHTTVLYYTGSTVTHRLAATLRNVHVRDSLVSKQSRRRWKSCGAYVVYGVMTRRCPDCACLELLASRSPRDIGTSRPLIAVSARAIERQHHCLTRFRTGLSTPTHYHMTDYP